jgi:ketosteroid isomerase-like protein
MKAGWAIAGAALALAGCNAQVSGGLTAEQQELLDKAAIADLLNRYYEGFGGSNAAAFNEFYTDDAVFDVNGVVAEGKEEIEGIYAGLDNVGTFHMIISNPVIDVAGDTATAKVMWTGVQNADISAPPTLVEQGREYDKLVKVDGKWLIQHRVVVADSGLPESMVATYEPRLDFSFAVQE